MSRCRIVVVAKLKIVACPALRMGSAAVRKSDLRKVNLGSGRNVSNYAHKTLQLNLYWKFKMQMPQYADFLSETNRLPLRWAAGREGWSARAVSPQPG